MITGSDGVTTEVVQACGVLESHGRTCKGSVGVATEVVEACGDLEGHGKNVRVLLEFHRW